MDGNKCISDKENSNVDECWDNSKEELVKIIVINIVIFLKANLLS